MARKIIHGVIREMKSNYNGSPWYGNSMLTILREVNPLIVFAYPIAGAHSIAEILCHIISWRESLSKLLQGMHYSVKQQESFDYTRIDPNHQTAWGSLVKALDENQRQIIWILEQADDELLNKKAPGRSYSLGRLIRHTLQHDVYHLGQIAVLKKQPLKA